MVFRVNKCKRYLSVSGEVKHLLDKETLKNQIDKYTSLCYRVLVNAYSDTTFDDLIFINFIVRVFRKIFGN